MRRQNSEKNGINSESRAPNASQTELDEGLGVASIGRTIASALLILLYDFVVLLLRDLGRSPAAHLAPISKQTLLRHFR
jgi:hypothetical protein